MDYKIGKVTRFDGYVGNIVTRDDKYLFVISDIYPIQQVKEGDLVYFRPEIINGIKRAFFVSRYIKEKGKTLTLTNDHKE